MAATGLWELFLGLSAGWVVQEALLVSWTQPERGCESGASPWWPRTLLSPRAGHRAAGLGAVELLTHLLQDSFGLVLLGGLLPL